jgi:hypothetical protein
MQHKIINTGDYLLIVDESEIKEGDWYIDLNLKQIFSKSNPQISKIEWQKKIIGHLPLNNSPILEGVPLLPPLEDEIIGKPLDNYIRERHNQDEYVGFIDGYNKAKEKYKYTEEDMVKCWKYASIDKYQVFGDKIGDSYMSFIQSLQQPKMPVGFNVETEKEICTCSCHSNPDMVHFVACCNGGYIKSSKVLTINNLQGLTQWVGEYIY